MYVLYQQKMMKAEGLSKEEMNSEFRILRFLILPLLLCWSKTQARLTPPR